MDSKSAKESHLLNRVRRKRKSNEASNSQNNESTFNKTSKNVKVSVAKRGRNIVKARNKISSKKQQDDRKTSDNAHLSDRLKEKPETKETQRPEISRNSQSSSSSVLNIYQKEVLKKKLEKIENNKSSITAKRKNIADSRLKRLRNILSNEVENETTNLIEMKETNYDSNDKQPPAKRCRIEKKKPIQNMEVDSIIDEINQARFNDCHQLNNSLDSFIIKKPHFEKQKCDNNTTIVVDTNIMLSHISVLDEILNYKSGKSNFIVMIPWRVFSELDNLKNNNRIVDANVSLGHLAQTAIRYLHKNLPINPRLIGQSLKEAYDHLYPCHIPDDEILNCCLQVTKSNTNVILLSNDKNLCNKASANNIKSYTYDTMKNYLWNCDNIESNLIESSEKLNNIVNLNNNDSTSKNSTIETNIANIGKILKDFLSTVLEEEMKYHYEELWEKVILHKPPWSIHDVFECILKHWIAVFSEVFPKRQKDLLSEIKFYFPRRRSMNKLTNDDVKSIVSSCAELIHPLQMNYKRQYSKMVRECSTALKKIVEIEVKSNVSDKITPNTNEETDSVMDITENCSNQIFSLQSTNTSYSFTENEIFNVFQFIWKGLSDFCCLLANSLKVDHCLEDKTSVSSLDLLIPQADSVTNQINLIIENMSRTLMINSVDESSPEYMKCEANKATESFYKILLDTTIGMNRNTPNFNNVQLFNFCTKYRKLLEDGFEKFTVLKNILEMCSEQYLNLSSRCN